MANANRVAVMVLALSPNHFDRATRHYSPVSVLHIVVAATILPSANTMPPFNILDQA